MEVLSGILVGLVALFLLAALGLTTLAAFGIMAALGFVTEMSFKRLFFVSFGLGLFAPLVAIGALGSAFEDGRLGNDLQEGITEVFPGAQDMASNWQDIGPRIEEIERSVEAGEIDREQARDQIEQVIADQTGIQLDLEGVPISEEDDALRIEANR